MPVTSGHPGPTAKSAGYWWLAAILLTIGSFGLGILLGLSAPPNENDWITGGFAAPFFITFFCGCVMSVLAAVVSFWRKEERAYISLLPAIPSLAFVCWMVAAFVQAGENRKRQAISTAQSYKQQETDWAQKTHWKAELQTHPELITNDDFWKAHKEPSRNTEWGLRWLLQDRTFVVTPEIRAYVIKNFPDAVSALFQTGRFTVAELQTIATDKDVNYGLRENAIHTLLDDDSFDFSSEWKALVRHEFPLMVHLLVSGKKLTKAELEELGQDPKTSEQVKSDIQFYLKRGYFKQ